MTAYILDANGLLRYLRSDIPEQADAVESLFQSVKKGESSVTIYPLVILEAIFVLWRLYKNEKRDIVKELLSVVDNPILDVRERLVVHSALKGWSEGAVSFVDWYLIFQSKQESKKIFTFDKKLAKAAKQIDKK